MQIEIDIGGQIQQKNYDSALGFRRENGIVKSVYLRSKDKKETPKEEFDPLKVDEEKLEVLTKEMVVKYPRKYSIIIN